MPHITSSFLEALSSYRQVFRVPVHHNFIVVFFVVKNLSEMLFRKNIWKVISGFLEKDAQLNGYG